MRSSFIMPVRFALLALLGLLSTILHGCDFGIGKSGQIGETTSSTSTTTTTLPECLLDATNIQPLTTPKMLEVRAWLKSTYNNFNLDTLHDVTSYIDICNIFIFADKNVNSTIHQQYAAVMKDYIDNDGDGQPDDWNVWGNPGKWAQGPVGTKTTPGIPGGCIHSLDASRPLPGYGVMVIGDRNDKYQYDGDFILAVGAVDVFNDIVAGGKGWQAHPTEELLHMQQRCIWPGIYSDDFGFVTGDGHGKGSIVGASSAKAQMGNGKKHCTDCEDECSTSGHGGWGFDVHAAAGVSPPLHDALLWGDSWTYGLLKAKSHDSCSSCQAKALCLTNTSSTNLNNCCLWEYNKHCLKETSCREVEFFFQFFTEYLAFSETYYRVVGTEWSYDSGGRPWLKDALPDLVAMFDRKILNCELPYRLPVLGKLPKPAGRNCKSKAQLHQMMPDLRGRTGARQAMLSSRHT